MNLLLKKKNNSDVSVSNTIIFKFRYIDFIYCSYKLEEIHWAKCSPNQMLAYANEKLLPQQTMWKLFCISIIKLPLIKMEISIMGKYPTLNIIIKYI